MGLDFFRKAVELEEKYRRPGMSFENTLQTNGVLLDDEWCEFLQGVRVPGGAQPGRAPGDA